MNFFSKLTLTSGFCALTCLLNAQSDFNSGSFGSGGGGGGGSFGSGSFNSGSGSSAFPSNSNGSNSNSILSTWGQILSGRNTQNQYNYNPQNSNPTAYNPTIATVNDNSPEGLENQWLHLYDKQMLTNTSIQPAFKGVDVPTNKYKVNAQEGAKIQLANGSSIDIPKNAFTDQYGKPISGDVEIGYREFHNAADIIASGIPMHNAVTGEFMETAGMFEISGKQGGDDIYVAADKNIKVKMASYNEDSNFDFWKYDENKGGWKEIDGGGQVPAQNYRPGKSENKPTPTMASNRSENPTTPSVSENTTPATIPNITRSFGINSLGIHNWDKLRSGTRFIPEPKKVQIVFDENAGKALDITKIPFFWVTSDGRSVVAYTNKDIQNVSFTPYCSDALVAILPDNKVAVFTGKDFGKIDRTQSTLVYDFRTAPQRIETVAQFTSVLELNR